MTSEYVGGREAAKLLGVHEDTIRNWEMQGYLRCVKLPYSGYRRYLRADVEALRRDMLAELVGYDSEVE